MCVRLQYFREQGRERDFSLFLLLLLYSTFSYSIYVRIYIRIYIYIYVHVYIHIFKRNYIDAKDVPANDIESSFRPFESVPNQIVQIVSEIREKFARRQRKEVTEGYRIRIEGKKRERKKEK